MSSSRLALILAALLALTLSAVAHDIPADATAQLMVRPADERLQILVRVPLRTMRDIDFQETGDGYLDVEQLAPQLPGIASWWIAPFIEIYEGESRLDPRVAAARVSLESDRSFRSFDEALSHMSGPKLANGDHVIWDQLNFDVLLEYPIHSGEAAFSIRPGLERLAANVVTVVRFYAPGGAVRAFEFSRDPGIVPLDPGWFQATSRFVHLGFSHILDGVDHLLFLFCLVIPFRRIRPLLVVVTAFTLAHSLTLLASAYGLAPDALWFPPLIEMLIAASIVYMALENIVGAGSAHRRWMIAFGFGLVHGFGFSFALRNSLQFAGTYLVTSLLAFNVGVELGQILVLALLVPLLELLFRFVVAERMGTIILSALVAHTGWHWMLDRGHALRQYSFEWPGLNSIAMALGGLALLVGVGGLAWTALRALEKKTAESSGQTQGAFEGSGAREI